MYIIIIIIIIIIRDDEGISFSRKNRPGERFILIHFDQRG